MNEKIENAISKTVQEAVDQIIHSIKFNLNNTFGGLLYSLKLELEKDGFVGDIDSLISIIINTSHYTGPENEEYPTWDKKRSKDIINRLAKKLQAHGITQSYGFSEHFENNRY